MTLAAALLILGGLLSNWNAGRTIEFFLLALLNALWPVVILACRAARGAWRTFFLWLIPLTVFATGYPIGGASTGSSDGQMLLLTIPAGLAA
jgi:hypothetical protein